jgi:hypothetical protein
MKQGTLPNPSKPNPSEIALKHNSSFVLAFALALLPAVGTAETIAGCTKSVLHDPLRQVYTCQGGLLIEAEAASKLTFIVPTPEGPPNGVRLDAGALWIELDPVQVETREPSFQIRPPQAIASVRGTTYAVDVIDGASAVFVAEGEVSVKNLAADRIVRLGPGEGVDIAAGKAFAVRTWGARRVDALRARFGR